MSLSRRFRSILSCPLSPNARAISRFPAGWSEDAMKSRICLRLGRPAERLRGIASLYSVMLNLFQHPSWRSHCPSRKWTLKQVRGDGTGSTQLAVLAAAAVDGRMDDRLVALRLAGDAGAHAGQRLAPLLRDRLAAIVAFLGALALRRQRAGAKDRILHRVLDLILNRAVARPSAGHEPSTFVMLNLFQHPFRRRTLTFNEMDPETSSG